METVDSHDDKVRYRDLMNAASDYFATEGRQRPQFITQANGTEIFCQASASIKAIVKQYLPKQAIIPIQPTPEVVRKPTTSLELIKAADSKHCTRIETEKALQRFESAIREYKPSTEIADLFSEELVLADDEPDQAKIIGEWLRTNQERGFSAEPKTKTEVYKKSVPVDPFAGLFRVSGLLRRQEGDTKLVDATREVVCGYYNTTSLPFTALKLKFSPKFKVLVPIECDIAPIVSADAIRIFWAFRHFKYSDWDTVVPIAFNLPWRSQEATAKPVEAMDEVAKKILSELGAHIESSIREKWVGSRA